MAQARPVVLGELDELSATTATLRPEVPHVETGGLVPMTAEDQIAVHGVLRGGAILSAHHRGGAAQAGFSMVVEGTEGRLEVTAPDHPHVNPVTVRGARGRDPLAPMALPEGRDAFADRAGTPAHALLHTYAAVRDDLRDGTAVAPGFADAVRRHRLLDAIQRSAAAGRRVRVEATQGT